ncbi:MAG: SAM-dependent methyltransferase [Verrucomicrobiales bacterium]|nr:SAM-dependent methyltransferase [Verrucomicrobiales bacterium]
MDVAEHNRRAWNTESNDGCDWSTPVTPDVIERAREGDWGIILTPKQHVPRNWFPETMDDVEILCLASGGGQQVPVLAAAGASVTSFDLSDEQLAKDKMVAQRDDLDIIFERGEMTDLGRFDDASFDVVFHPASNCFVPDVNPVWRECHRVLRPGGSLLSGFMNPAFYMFDHAEASESRVLEVKYPLPYSDLTTLTDSERERMLKIRGTLEFGHTLDDLIGGQLKCGFTITGFYEDYWEDAATLLNAFSPTSMATRAVK